MPKPLHDNTFMGTQPIGSLLIRLSLPAMVGMLVNALYNFVDTIFVGQYVGPYGIAALSIAFPIQMLFGAFAQTFGYGAASIISRRLGEKRPVEASAAAGNALIGAFGITLVLAVFTYIFRRPVILFFGATEEILPYTEQYIRVILVGIPFLSVKMCSSGILRAEGQAKASMVFMIIGAVLNTILDPVLIFGFKMGITGAALATVISQVVAVTLVVYYFAVGRSSLPFSISSFTVRLPVMSDIISLGFATFVRQSGTSMMSTLVNNLLRFYGGSLVIAAYGMIIRLMIFIMMPMFGLVHGFQPIAGYNYGARNFQRVRSVLATSVLMATLFASLCWLFIMMVPTQILSVFSRDQELLAIASPALKMVMAALPLVGLQVIGSTLFQAVGKRTPAIFLSLSRQFVFLIPLLFLFSKVWGIEGVWISFPVADTLASLVTAVWVVHELRQLRTYEPSHRTAG